MTSTPLIAATTASGTPVPGWLHPEDARLEDLVAVLAQPTRLADYPHADHVQQQVLVYDGHAIREAAADPGSRRRLQAELARALADGPGLVIVTAAFEDLEVVDRATAAFEALIADQRRRGLPAGDHFAVPGANDRVWNAFEKLAVANPEAFVAYYANEVIALVSCAWLGPGYQVTSQVNVVNPGGAGQQVHRDYHLGFASDETCTAYPAHVHALSQVLTLQGAVAHCDMPLESGPTLYLPHSQKFRHGYVAYRRPDFQEHFADNHVRLPMAKGDAVFFNPALFHAAGSNATSTVRRMANLLQISSAFGRAMETVDRERVVNATYAALQVATAHSLSARETANAIAAAAEGYAFPTNLDRDQPVDGMAPRTQAEVVTDALRDGLSGHMLRERLAVQAHSKVSR